MELELLPALGLVFLLGLALGKLAQCGKLPSLLGYLLAGVILGSSGLDLLSAPLGELSPHLRQLALLMILLKAGLNLSWESLRSVGKPAILLSFLPASFEIVSAVIFAPLLFSLSLWEAALLGSVLAAVSPAVVVPRMVAYLESCKDSETRKVPEMVLAGASLDDALVIFCFSTLVTMDSATVNFLHIPVSILLALGVGAVTGKLLGGNGLLQKLVGEEWVLLLLGVSCVFLAVEEVLPFSALLAVMALGMSFPKGGLAIELSGKFTALWKGAELLLFVLVGAELAVSYLWKAGVLGVLLVTLGLVARSVGVVLAVSPGKLTGKQKLFVVLSYLPKATVQAGIGGIPLAMGLACGELLLTMAVLSIVLTAPVGAVLLDRYGKDLLVR